LNYFRNFKGIIMKPSFRRKPAMALATIVTGLLLFTVAVPQSSVDEKRVRAHMEFLASDDMQGRGSGTKYEKLAGLYLASQMKQFGIAPGGDKDGIGLGAYIQTVEIERTRIGKTTLDLGPEKSISLTGLRIGNTSLEGPLKRISIDETAEAGSITIVTTLDGTIPREAFPSLFGSPAKALILIAPPALMQQLSGFARRASSMTRIKGTGEGESASLYLVAEEKAGLLDSIPVGSIVNILSEITESTTSNTWNSVGKIEGSGGSGEAILLSAHMDHVGVRENAPGDDKIFNGADDDASGCVAVLELARILAAGPRPKRTVYFAFFGSEEAGGFGSRYFVGTFDRPLEKLVANLQFEMLGRPDAKVGKDELWLTGYERSDLGSELARNGAKLVADPHPEENFFERSDNITLARRGVVAHTVSSYGLHTDYHQASDEISTMDFPYMTNAIDSIVKPVIWLVNTDWKPAWKEGMKP